MTHVFSYFNSGQEYLNTKFWVAEIFLSFHEVKAFEDVITEIYFEALKVIEMISTLNIHFV